MTKPGTSFNVLLVEDEPGDVRLIKEAIKESKFLINLYVVYDGDEALDFLFKRKKYELSPTPDMILLDLNIPKIKGFEVLKIIKEDKNLKIILVVVLTSSKIEEDILKSYKLHANCFVSKPPGFNDFIKIVKSIEHFWFTIVKIPLK